MPQPDLTKAMSIPKVKRGFDTSKLSGHTRRLLRAARGEKVARQEDAVLELVLMGYTNIQISMRLGTSEQVVKNSVHYLLARYDALNRTHLVIKILSRRHKEAMKGLAERLESCSCNRTARGFEEKGKINAATSVNV